MSVELAVAYISLVPSAKGMASKLGSELGAPLEAAARKAADKAAASFGDQFTKGLSSASSKLRSVGGDMVDVGKKLSTHVTLPIVGAGAAAVKTAGDFQKSLNTMAAVAGVPGPELEQLRGLAIKLGADTVFSANDAADAMLELSKAGISTADIMGGALANTLDLAAAGDLGLADAATIASNAMNVFHLSGQSSKEAVDALAGAANASSADVSDLALALAQGGQSAAAAGFTIQETTAALAAFADAGLRGSDAGTSLKTFLLSLVPTTNSAQDAMKNLGLSFVDGKGNINDLTTVAGKLQAKLGGLTQEQQQVALKTIFGTDAFRAANIIMQKGAAGMQPYLEATGHVGNAANVASARMKGWAGTSEQLKGSLETAGLAIGQILIPTLSIVAGWATRAANAFTALPKSTQKIVIGVALAAAAIGPLTTLIGGLTSAIGFLISPVGLVIVAVAALVAGVIYAYTHFEGFRNAVQAVGRFITGTAIPAFQTVARVVADVGAKVAAILVPTFRVLADIARVVGTALAVVLVPAFRVVSSIVATVAGILGAVLAPVIRLCADIFMNILLPALRVGAQVVLAVANVLAAVLVPVFHVVGDALTFVAGLFAGTMNTIRAVVTGAIGAVVAVITGGINAVRAVVSAVLGAITGAWSAAWNGLRSAVSAAWNGIKAAVSGGIGDVLGFVRSLPGRILGALGDLGGLLFEAGREIIRGLINGVKAMAGAIADAAKNVVSGAVNSVKHFLHIGSPSKLFQTIGQQTMDGLRLGLEDRYRSVGQSLSGFAATLAATDLGSLTGPVITPTPTASTATAIAATFGGAASGSTAGVGPQTPVRLTVESTLDGQVIARSNVDRAGLALATKGY